MSGTDGQQPGQETPTPQNENKLKRLLKGAPLGYLLAGVVAAALSVAIYAGSQYIYSYLAENKAKKDVLDNPASAEIQGEATAELRKTSESFRAVARMVGPAVVKIKATKGGNKGKRPGRMFPPQGRRRQMPPGGGGPEEDEGGGGGQGRDPFFDFFERFGTPFPFEQDIPQESLGSGIIIDKRGYVVTNNHVVDQANKILVVLSSADNASDDGTELKATVVGMDPKTDLAVLKVEQKGDLPAVEWADSDKVEVGDWAIAIGSPFALSRSVTVGIVSAKGRSSRVIGGDYSELLQTDAAINPGNSGGPLCTIDGKVMGVNTAIYTRSGGYMGIGFAIPSNVARGIADTLIKDGKIIRGWLGVYIQPIDAELAKELKIETGVAIHAVMEESPAAKAELKAGDVIVKVDKTDIKDVNQLQRVIAGFKPGQTVRIEVISYADKKRRTVKVNIGELPDQEPQAKAPQEGAETKPDRLGLVVTPAAKGQGVQVVGYQPGSIAERVGIREGDLIVSVDGQPVKTVEKYRELVESGKKYLSLGVKRDKQSLFFRFSVTE